MLLKKKKKKILILNQIVSMAPFNLKVLKLIFTHGGLDND